MPFENNRRAAKRIAVIGGGISGMGAAHLLASEHSVALFEDAPRLGGHARTVIAGKNGDQPVDTGFIVFNYATYPHLTKLFDELDVPIVESNMSFGVSIDGGRLEYALNSMSSVFARRRNLVSPRFLGMIRDILKFNKSAEALAKDPDMTIGGLLEALGTGDWFRDYYILPFSGAIWSTPKRDILDFPAKAMMTFFKNHGLLDYAANHQWYTIDGGSAQYVGRLQTTMARSGVDIRLSAGVQAVRRTPFGADVKTHMGDWESFDEVVFATHSDTTLGLLSDATETEQAALGAIRYTNNEVVLHADASMMPKRKAAWASWVYTEAQGASPDRIGVSYWMNSLQPIPMQDPMFVTLNPARPIREDLIYDQVNFAHPQYDVAALAGQDTMRSINGQKHTWFCGAWMKNGFHEDGLASAVDVVEAMAKRDDIDVALAAE